MGMDNLENLADMLNGMPDAVYATGIEPPVTSEALYRKYENVFRNRDEIFAGIYPIGSQELSGLIRAVIRRIHGDVLWISSFVVFAQYRRNGIGSEAVELLVNHISKEESVPLVCLCVLDENHVGRAFWLKNGFLETMKIRKVSENRRLREMVVMSRTLKS